MMPALDGGSPAGRMRWTPSQSGGARWAPTFTTTAKRPGRNQRSRSGVGLLMQRTIFTTPVVNTLLRGASLAFFRATGWQMTGALPAGTGKCVLIAAPHTSNWDLPYTLMAAFALRLNVRWMGKASIFRWPFGGLMRWLGGIAVDRSKNNNLVAASAQELAQASGTVQLVVPPEGTRGRTRHWKTGFYFIAQQAGVPIILAYLDYERRVGGLGPVFHPTGDVERDLQEIKRFYAPIKGKRADSFSAD